MQQYLTDEQIVDITSLRRPSAQARCLDAMGIRSRTKANGRLLVLWDDVLGDSAAPAKKPEPVSIDMRAICGS